MHCSHIFEHIAFKCMELSNIQTSEVIDFPYLLNPCSLLHEFQLLLSLFSVFPSLSLFCTTNVSANEIHISALSKAPDRNPENIKIEAHLPHEMNINWKVGGHVFFYEILSRQTKFQSTEAQSCSLGAEGENKRMLLVFFSSFYPFEIPPAKKKKKVCIEKCYHLHITVANKGSCVIDLNI